MSSSIPVYNMVDQYNSVMNGIQNKCTATYGDGCPAPC